MSSDEKSAEPVDADAPVIEHLGILLVDLQPPFLKSLRPGTAERVVQRNCFVIEVARCFGLPLALTEQLPEKLGSTDDRLLDAWLEAHAIDHLLIGGLETAICVHASVVDALGRDLGVTVLSDAVAGRQEAETPTLFAAMRQAGAHVLPAETVFYSLLGTAKHPQFRTFTSLVKTYSPSA